MNGVLAAAGSTSRTRQKPIARTPVRISVKSKATGRGAGKLASPNAYGVYHQFLPGPSVQGNLMGTTAQGELPRIEGSEEGVTWDSTGNVVGQSEVVNTAEDGEGEDAKGNGFQIPKGLNDRQRSLLKATQDERARGVVHVLKCIICPNAGFSNWEAFTRHCDKTEGHLEDIVFCRFVATFWGAQTRGTGTRTSPLHRAAELARPRLRRSGKRRWKSTRDTRRR